MRVTFLEVYILDIFLSVIVRIKYIDLFHEYSSGIILTDGIHPNMNSYKKIGRLIGKQLDSMMI